MADRRVYEYQSRAAQCTRQAQRATDLQAKLMLLEMAVSWLKLAEQANKNNETVLVYETPIPDVFRHGA